MVGLVYNCMWGSDAYPFQLVYFPSDYVPAPQMSMHTSIFAQIDRSTFMDADFDLVVCEFVGTF